MSSAKNSFFLTGPWVYLPQAPPTRRLPFVKRGSNFPVLFLARRKLLPAFPSPLTVSSPPQPSSPSEYPSGRSVGEKG